MENTCFERHLVPWVKVLEGGESDNEPYQEFGEVIFSTKKGDVQAHFSGIKLPGDLAVFIAHDDFKNSTVSLLTKEKILEKIGNNDIEKLMELAVTNLLWEVEFKLIATTYGGRGIVAGGDYEVAAILSIEILSQVAADMKSHLVIATPARDVLLFSASENTHMIKEMKKISDEIYANEERPLSKKLLYFDCDSQKLSVYNKKRVNKK